MTKVVVDPGICGFIAIVEVVKLSGKIVGIKINSNCDAIARIGDQMSRLEWTRIWRQHAFFFNELVPQCIQHIACPVPVAILKAIEVEVGIALPKDVVIRFENET